MSLMFLNYYLKKKNKYIFSIYNNSFRLRGKPQRKGITIKTRICTPRKPNSARRQVAKIAFLYKFKDNILAYIPGGSHNIRKHSRVLIKGKGARDVPNISYKCIRGKYDFLGILNKKKRKSIYGSKKSINFKSNKKFRFL